MVRRITTLLVSAGLFLILCLYSTTHAQESSVDTVPRTSSWIDSLQTFSSYIAQHVEKFAPPEYIKQKKARNGFQRDAYCGTLFDTINSDGLTALLGFCKMQLNVGFSLIHQTFVLHEITLPSGEKISYTLPDSWEYPVDPWKKEWWFYR